MALPNRRMGHLDESGVVPAAPCAQCDTHGFKIREECGRFLKVMAIHVTLLFLSTLFYLQKVVLFVMLFIYRKQKVEEASGNAFGFNPFPSSSHLKNKDNIIIANEVFYYASQQ